jgi:hypothetical protein
MSKLKIALDVEDLQKILLDENGEIPIEIRQNIAQTFANRYLKGVITEDLKKEMANYISVARREIMYSILNSESHYDYGQITFNNKFKTKIIQEIDSYIKSQILLQGETIYNDMIDIAQAKYKEAVNKFEESINQELLTQLVDKAVNEKFSKLLK